jgi:hypothetical protein
MDDDYMSFRGLLAILFFLAVLVLAITEWWKL